MYRPSFGDEYADPVVEVLQKSQIDVLLGQVRDLLQCGLFPHLGRVQFVRQEHGPGHEAHARPAGRVVTDGLENVRIGDAVTLDPGGRKRTVEQGRALELYRVGDDPAGEHLSENRLSVERFRQVVGGYTEVNELGIDPVKPGQPLSDSAASLDVFPETLR